MVGLTALALTEPRFTLSWEHSVERVEWQEVWTVGTAPATLTLTEARVRGSGAGMEPGADAVLVDGWWLWHPDLSVPRLALAASGATRSGWTLCADGTCRTLGLTPGAPLVLAPCS